MDISNNDERPIEKDLPSDERSGQPLPIDGDQHHFQTDAEPQIEQVLLQQDSLTVQDLSEQVCDEPSDEPSSDDTLDGEIEPAASVKNERRIDSFRRHRRSGKRVTIRGAKFIGSFDILAILKVFGFVILFSLFLELPQIALGYFMGISFSDLLKGVAPDENKMLINFIFGLLLLVVSIGIVFMAIRSRYGSFVEYLGLKPAKVKHYAITLITLFGVLYAVSLIINLFTGTVEQEFTDDMAKMLDMIIGSRVLLFVVVFQIVVVASVWEEILFRGYMQRALIDTGLGVMLSIGITSAVWALLHQQYDSSGILIIFTMGIVLGYARHITGSLHLAIAVHALKNAIAVFLWLLIT